MQSHMLEVCPSVADGKISIKVCPLSMGDREDPARLVFTSKDRPGYCNIPDRSWRPFPSDHQRCGLQEDRETDAEASSSNVHSGHHSQILRQVQKHGSLQAEPTIQHSLMT